MFKKIISSVLMAAIVVSSTFLFSSCGQIESKNPKRPKNIPGLNTSEGDLGNDEYRLISENDKFAFYFNDYTTDIRVVNKKTKYVWGSEINNASNDEVRRGEVFVLKYTDNSGADLEATSKESVEQGMFSVSDTENGVKVKYGAGYVNYQIKFPLALSEKRLEELGEKLGDPFYLAEYYELFDYTTADSVAEYDKDEIDSLKNSYPKAFDKPWYYMPVDNYKSYKQIVELNDLFKSIGYTEEELESDNDGLNVPSNENVEEFAFSVEYNLTETGLHISIPEKEIYYSKEYPLEAVQVLPGLMDFDNTVDGYYLLPDGSGSIMNFNNSKGDIRYASTYVQMYGVDNSRVVEEKTAYYNDAVFPVFGTCVKGKAGKANAVKDYNGVFGIITSGDTFAGLSADNYNEANSKDNNLTLEFRVNERVSMDAFSYSGDSDGDAKYSKHQFQRYLGNIAFDLYFLSGVDSTYSGMAKFYSDYIFGENTANTDPKDYYSTVETLGVINTTKKFFGIDYNSKQTLTDFTQVSKIASELQKNGFKNMNIKLTGWCNGGYEHSSLNRIKVSSDAGGDDGLKELSKNLQKIGVGLYPDIDFQNVYKSEETPSSGDRAATLNSSDSIVTEYSPVDFMKEKKLSKYVLTKEAFTENFNDFMENYKEYGIKNVSYRGIGSEINSNFKDDESYTERQETYEALVKLVESAKKDGYNIMGSGGQAAYLKYLSVINEMPIESAHYDKTDYSVPFTAMVLSGHIDYTYQPINLSNNNRGDLLRIIEAGAGAYYKLTGTYYDELANTSYDSLYSTVYSDIKDQIFDTYSYVSDALDGVYGTRITSHEQLADGVFKTTYQNGTVIYVNYNSKDYKAKGITVASQDYTKEVNR
ncbi:MAG: hypothetical protein IJO19_00525 [Clostridia bacterium]|nr:hypothetical protein [Clostridia bacterium]